MNTKAISILTLTLLLGIALGFMLSGYVVKKRIDQLSDQPPPIQERLQRKLFAAIQPDSAQAAQIEPIIAEFAQAQLQYQQQHFSQIDSLITNFEAKLLPILLPQQKDSYTYWKNNAPLFKKYAKKQNRLKKIQNTK